MKYVPNLTWSESWWRTVESHGISISEQDLFRSKNRNHWAGRHYSCCLMKSWGDHIYCLTGNTLLWLKGGMRSGNYRILVTKTLRKDLFSMKGFWRLPHLSAGTHSSCHSPDWSLFELMLHFQLRQGVLGNTAVSRHPKCLCLNISTLTLFRACGWVAAPVQLW